MRAREFITEAFDRPYAFNWSRGDHGDYDVFVKLPDGSPLNISFVREGDDGWHVAFDRGHSQDITGEGDAQRIFATVLTSIHQFIIKQNPDRLYFSASKDVEHGQNPESRARLYERMVNRYAAAMGYDVVVDDRRGHTMFILDKEQGLAEQSTHEDRHPNDTPYGPETKPTMPKGTVRVDVSDVYDWYKLGMHISDLKGLGKHDFGKGPPSTIFSFGDEETEHKYIKDLEKTGLTTTDIDPVDPNQPKGMPRQKVDPTFNVNEEEFNGIDITMDIEGDEIMVTATGNGRELGHVLFVDEGEYLMPQDLEVDERFQGQGIAAAMYDYVKSKGYKIRRSGQQTDAGAGFWGKHRPDQNVWESESSDSVLFLGPDAVIVGQEHGKPLKLSDQEQQKIRDIAERHGAWYEGNGMDQKHTKGIIDDYRGSWDDDLLSSKIKGYPAPFLYVLFSNIKENDTVEGKIGFDPDSTIFDRILDTQPSANYFPDRKFDAETLQKFLKSVSEGQYDFVRMSQAPATKQNVTKFFTLGERLMFPDNWEEYPYRAGRVAKSVNDLRDKFLASRKRGVYVAGSDHLRAVQQFLDQSINENFADGKVKGKSRPGRVKRAGASCNGSVTDLRARAKKASGELAKMYHWCANMKSGRKK